ncbi:hypothetical protein Cpir12675_005008 [Ceratocystis pirilliformis]|uniref:Uncharacterized protein n=1 Tax=Ceratocystis pirilliformis TaxID=259994 RepID=A0ABR3YSJ6_9PEZI
MLHTAAFPRRSAAVAVRSLMIQMPLQPISGLRTTQAATLLGLCDLCATKRLVSRRFQSTNSDSDLGAQVPNPRVPRNMTPPRPEKKYKYIWRDPSTFTSWKDYWDELNPKFLIEKEYWKESYGRNKPLTVAWFMFVFFVWTPACVAVFYDQFLKPDPTSKFPSRVKKHLRKAIYWAKYKRDDARAMESFMQAFQAMQDLKMDPFSDECMGAYMLMIKYLGTLQRFNQALDICMVRRQACLEWVANLADLVDRGLVDQFGAVRAGDEDVVSSVLPNAAGENVWARRTRLLKWAVVMSAEMGTQCHSEGSYDALHKRGRELLEWAVSQVLKENQRRFQKGVKTMEDDWMSTDQIANLFQMLGNAYQQSGDDDLSIPLFFKGLQMCKDRCDQSLLMISMAASFFNTDPEVVVRSQRRDEVYATLAPSDREALPKTAQDAISASRNWTRIVNRQLNDIPLWEYTPSCKQAAVTSKLLHGELLWHEGKYDEARHKFELSLSAANLFENPQGARDAQAALGRPVPATADATSKTSKGTN